MLSFDLRSLEAQAAIVDDQLSADDPVWQEGDPKPDTGVHVKGRLSATGTGQFYWHGHISGDLTIPCAAASMDAQSHVEDESHIIYAEPDETNEDDPDIYPVDASSGVLDLRPAIREQWLLAQAHYALCREDCKGICPRCGKDRKRR
jgi:uncharacterized protein